MSSLIDSLPIVKKEKILSILDYLEDFSLKRVFVEDIKKRDIASIYISLIQGLIFSIYFFLTLNINLSFISISNQIFLILGIFVVFLEIISSYISNKWVYFSINFFSQLFLTPFVQKILNIFPKEKNRTILLFQNYYNTYIYDYYYSMSKIIPVILSIISLSILVIYKPTYYYILFIVLLITLILIICGYLFSVSSRNIHESFIKEEKLNEKDVTLRVWTPLGTNLITIIFLPFSIVYLVTNNLSEIVPFISYIYATSDFIWNIVKKYESAQYTKFLINDISNTFKKLSKSHIFNNNTFKKQCKLNTPKELSLKKSKKNSSLIVKSFIPMYLHNKKETLRKFTFEFKPGIYQINGYNGVGKTTFLKALSLPSNYSNEYSKGEVAICGEPFFNCSNSLNVHRNMTGYIGHISIVPKIEKKHVSKLKKFPLIQSVILNIFKSRKHINSEGEQAIISLIHYYFRSLNEKNFKLLIIDEVFSRIHNSEKYKVREEALEMLSEISKNMPNLYIFIVDHMTKIKTAKQLMLERNDLQTL